MNNIQKIKTSSKNILNLLSVLFIDCPMFILMFLLCGDPVKEDDDL